MFLKIKQKLEQPLFCLRFISVAICLIGLMRMFAIIAPPTVIAITLHVEGSNIFLELARSFNAYLDAVQETFDIQSKAGIIYLFAFSFFISLFFIVSGIFLFLRRLWARKMLLFLLILTLLNYFVITFLIGRFIIEVRAIVTLVFYIALLVFFTRRQTVQLFTKDA